jgi:hypothetical protein
MLKQYLADINGTPLNVQTGLDGSQCLVTDSSRVLAAHWHSTEITIATTTTIIAAKPGESVLLTDLIVTLSKKVNAATIIPCFSDGTNTVNLFTFEAETSPFQFSHAFQGGIRGWKDADFQIVTNQATTVSVFVGYVHISPEQTKPYGEWDGNR